MVEIDLKTNIYARDVMDAEDAESFVNNEIRQELLNKILVALEDMAYIDLVISEDNKTFNIEASLVLCTVKDVETNFEIMAQQMSKHSLDESQITEVLSTMVQDMGGF